MPQNGTMMYRNSPRLGTIIVPKRKEQAFPAFVYQYAPKIDPNLGGNRYMEWFTFERKRYGTMHRTTGSGHMFSEGSRKGTFFRTSCAEPYDAVKGLRKELSCKHCLQILQIASRLHVVTDPLRLVNKFT